MFKRGENKWLNVQNSRHEIQSLNKHKQIEQLSIYSNNGDNVSQKFTTDFQVGPEIRSN